MVFQPALLVAGGAAGKGGESAPFTQKAQKIDKIGVHLPGQRFPYQVQALLPGDIRAGKQGGVLRIFPEQAGQQLYLLQQLITERFLRRQVIQRVAVGFSGRCHADSPISFINWSMSAC